MRLEPGQYGYQYEIEIRVKILNMTNTFFSAVSYSQNPSGIDPGYDAGLYGWTVDTVLTRPDLLGFLKNDGMEIAKNSFKKCSPCL